MKKVIYSVVLTILVLYILLFPGPAVKAASFGLTLWYTRLLPTLLPFSILSYIFVASGLLNSAAALLHGGLKYLLPISPAGIYPLAAGFLFGFPLGSRITAQMVEQDALDYREGNRIFIAANNISPVFISGFTLQTSLGRPDLFAPTLAILYLPPILYFILQTRLSKKRQAPPVPTSKKAAPGFQMNFKIIDAGIMSGFETLTKLGGYIMLFAIFSKMVGGLSFLGELPRCLLSGLIEITNGTASLAASSLSFGGKYVLILACTAFGGLSGVAQTASMTREAGFSMGSYVKTKLLFGLVSALLAMAFAKLFL